MDRKEYMRVYMQNYRKTESGKKAVAKANKNYWDKRMDEAEEK